jgi:hypothetical protein
MVSQDGAASSGAASGATHILLRISEFASSPQKRGSILCNQRQWIPACAGMTISRNRRHAAASRLHRVRAFGDLLQSTRPLSLALSFLSP